MTEYSKSTRGGTGGVADEEGGLDVWGKLELGSNGALGCSSNVCGKSCSFIRHPETHKSPLPPRTTKRGFCSYLQAPLVLRVTGDWRVFTVVQIFRDNQGPFTAPTLRATAIRGSRGGHQFLEGGSLSSSVLGEAGRWWPYGVWVPITSTQRFLPLQWHEEHRNASINSTGAAITNIKAQWKYAANKVFGDGHSIPHNQCDNNNRDYRMIQFTVMSILTGWFWSFYLPLLHMYCMWWLFWW